MNRVHHLHIKGITYFFFLLLALSAQSLMSEGFAAGTEIYTPAGFRPIEEIEPGHEVLSFDRAKQLLAKNIVLQRHCHAVDDLVQVHFSDHVIEVDDKQRFLDADLHEWCEAKKLASGQRIVTHNQVAKTITSIQRKKLAQARVLYALSLCNGPRNFCVTKDKIVAHNFTLLLGIASIVLQVGRVGWNGFLAWRGGRGAEQTLKEVMEYYAAQGFSEELNCLTLNDITQHEAMLTLSRPVQDQLGRILNKYGGKARLSACTLDEVIQFHMSGVLNAAAATKHYGQMTPDGIAANAHRAGLSGATRGAIGGAVNLTINLVTGNVDSVGDAVNTVVQPAVEGAVKAATLTASKDLIFVFSNRAAPIATSTILPYIPYVGTLWSCYTIIRDGYALGKDVNAFFKKGSQKHKGGSKIPQFSNQSGGSSSGGSNGSGGKQGDAVGAVAGLTTAKNIGKALSDNKDKIQQAGRVVGEKIVDFANWKKFDWVKNITEPYKAVKGSLRIKGGFSGLPPSARFLSPDKLHRGELEVWTEDGKHLGAWVMDMGSKVLRQIKEAKLNRKFFER